MECSGFKPRKECTDGSTGLGRLPGNFLFYYFLKRFLTNNVQEGFEIKRKSESPRLKCGLVKFPIKFLMNLLLAELRFCKIWTQAILCQLCNLTTY